MASRGWGHNSWKTHDCLRKWTGSGNSSRGCCLFLGEARVPRSSCFSNWVEHSSINRESLFSLLSIFSVQVHGQVLLWFRNYCKKTRRVTQVLWVLGASCWEAHLFLRYCCDHWSQVPQLGSGQLFQWFKANVFRCEILVDLTFSTWCCFMEWCPSVKARTHDRQPVPCLH